MLKSKWCFFIKEIIFLLLFSKFTFYTSPETTSFILICQLPLYYKAIMIITLKEWFNFIIIRTQRMIRTMFSSLSFPLVNSLAAILSALPLMFTVGPIMPPGRSRMRSLFTPEWWMSPHSSGIHKHIELIAGLLSPFPFKICCLKTCSNKY